MTRCLPTTPKACIALAAALMVSSAALLHAQSTTDPRSLRQPSLSAMHIARTYGADVWVVPTAGGDATRLTWSPAGEETRG